MSKNQNNEVEEDIEINEGEENLLDKDEFIAKLNNDLVEQKKKADEYFEHLKRNMAEFDNFKKRMTKEKDNMYSTIVSDVLFDLLPVIDNFEKALQADTKDKSFKSGMEMIYNGLKDTLSKMGMEEIQALGTEFDPNLHEAVMHIEDDKYKEKEVVEVLRKGYKIGDKIIRHAMVKVAN